MLEKKERIIIWAAIGISVIAIVAVAMLATIGRQSAGDVDVVHRHEYDHHREHPPSGSLTENTDESAKIDVKLSGNYKLSLEDVIKAARTWQPIYSYWFGREAPDFTLTDINGKEHKLSDYRGKDVMIIFWATWCGPCIAELPHLIALRNLISEDKLAMLAISSENAALVKKFAAERKINYTVLLRQGDMIRPYSMVRAIPSSFFIDPEGKIKLATEGMVSLGEIKAILQAE